MGQLFYLTFIGVQFLGCLALAAQDLPSNFKQHTYTVENPLVLEYAFGVRPQDKVYLDVVNYPNMNTDLFFFHMHMNEKTAKAAGEEAVRAHGGTFVCLRHFTGDRNMKITVNGTAYEFDPNRIFTPAGLADKTSPRPSGRDLAVLQKFVDWILRTLETGRLGGDHPRLRPMVIALHNNTDDSQNLDPHDDLLSIRTEKALMGLDNRDVFQNKSWDIDNFYIATLKPTYDSIVSQINPNISLRMETPRDIGYLSNWMIQQGIDYVNVETQHGDSIGNQFMIEALQTLFGGR